VLFQGRWLYASSHFFINIMASIHCWSMNMAIHIYVRYQDINLCFTLYAACPLNRARPWSEVNIISVLLCKCSWSIVYGQALVWSEYYLCVTVFYFVLDLRLYSFPLCEHVVCSIFLYASLASIIFYELTDRPYHMTLSVLHYLLKHIQYTGEIWKILKAW
jgi:hypothetical protein